PPSPDRAPRARASTARGPGPDDERRPDDERLRMHGPNARFRLRLRAAVLRHRRGLVLLDVRGSLAAVEDDVRRQVEQPRAEVACRTRDVLRSFHGRLPGVRSFLPVRGVDHDIGPEPLERGTYRTCVAYLDSCARCIWITAEQLPSEESARTGDVKSHAGRARRRDQRWR